MVKKSEPSAPPIYPNLDQYVQDEEDEGKTFRLKRISDIREFLEKELETRGRYRRLLKICLKKIGLKKKTSLFPVGRAHFVSP